MYFYREEKTKLLEVSLFRGSTVWCMVSDRIPFASSGFRLSERAEMKAFGALGVHVKNIITYSLSPFEQKVFTGIVTRGVPNIIRRFSEEIFYILPGVGTAAVVYYYGTKDFERRKRKNPADYVDEE